MGQKEFLVTQHASFTWKVTAHTAWEAEYKASQLDYADAWESYADAVDLNDIVEYKEAQS